MAGAQFYFEKVRDRKVWDFPLVNVASATSNAGDPIERIRMVVNAAAARRCACKRSKRPSSASPATRRRRSGRTNRHRGGAGASLQRLQGAVDAEPGEARDQGQRRHLDQSSGPSRPLGVRHGFRQVGAEPLGREHSDARLVDALLGLARCRPDVPRGARQLHAALGAPETPGDRDRPAGERRLPACPSASSGTRSWRGSSTG